jgi:uncharacterized protein DUF6456
MRHCPTDRRAHLPRSTVALLLRLAGQDRGVALHGARAGAKGSAADVARLLSAGLARRNATGLEISAAGHAFLRRANPAMDVVDPFRAQHLSLAREVAITADGPAMAIVDEAESPLVWLARRKARDGQPLIEPVQFLAGERLRADFTFAQLTPRLTVNLDAPATHERRGSDDMALTDAVVAARQRVRGALDAVGPAFAGLLLDVCCFLKRLEDVERERRWPPRTGKIVLQLGLDGLARHYGLASQARGLERVPMRAWSAADACARVDGG